MTITELNDQFRKTFIGGKVMVTAGIASLDESLQQVIVATVQGFNQFNKSNDPHGEHDCGKFSVSSIGGNTYSVFWKIDYFDAACEFGSEDPSDPAQTTRVLTIMLAEEY